MASFQKINIMKKSIFLSLFLLVLFFSGTDAQSYKNAVGLRLGSPVAVTFKHFLSEESAVEVFAGTRSYGFDLGYGYGYYGYGYGLGYYDRDRIRNWVIGAAYQYHKPIELDFLDGLGYYFGGGASVYFWNYGEYYEDQYSSTSFGIQGYIGLNYTFENIPLNLSADWTPTIFINSYLGGFRGGYGAVAARFVLN